MKTFIIATLLLLTSSSLVSANCAGEHCSRVRRPVVNTLSTTKNIIVSPFKRVRNNRLARQAANAQ